MDVIPMKALKRDLRLVINDKFIELGMNGDHHIFREYKKLLMHHQLERFYISDLDWFKGAADLIELVDQLHTQLTPAEDFHILAEMLDLEVPETLSKEELAQLVKAHPSWKAKAFDLELQRRLD
jgi:hypothetical protein